MAKYSQQRQSTSSGAGIPLQTVPQEPPKNPGSPASQPPVASESTSQASPPSGGPETEANEAWKAEIERLAWNLAGCLTIAEAEQPTELPVTAEVSPALLAVNKLAKKLVSLQHSALAVSGASCSNCPHWQEIAKTQLGDCRRNAPAGMGRMTFPQTLNKEWCGEHPSRKVHM